MLVLKESLTVGHAELERLGSKDLSTSVFWVDGTVCTTTPDSDLFFFFFFFFVTVAGLELAM